MVAAEYTVSNQITVLLVLKGTYNQNILTLSRAINMYHVLVENRK